MQDGISSYEAALRVEPGSKDLWLNLGMACKELCIVDRAEEVGEGLADGRVAVGRGRRAEEVRGWPAGRLSGGPAGRPARAARQ